MAIYLCVVIVMFAGKMSGEQIKEAYMENYEHLSLIQNLINQNKYLSIKLEHMDSEMTSLKLESQQQKTNVQRLEKTMHDSCASCKNMPLNEIHVLVNNQVKRQEDVHISFSAYMDHEVLNHGKNQVVQFQHVILNDGQSYNNYTGIFTVPRSGVYMLAFFLEDYHRFQSIFHLLVNGQILTSAIVDPLPDGQNVQGGNVVFARLNAGDSVWVSANEAGDNVEGYGALRTSTFSGHFLYA